MATKGKKSDRVIWARKSYIQSIAQVPDNYLDSFARKNPRSVRKFGKVGGNATRLFRVADVLKSVEKIGG